jgi:hypothetical protein
MGIGRPSRTRIRTAILKCFVAACDLGYTFREMMFRSNESLSSSVPAVDQARFNVELALSRPRAYVYIYCVRKIYHPHSLLRHHHSLAFPYHLQKGPSSERKRSRNWQAYRRWQPQLQTHHRTGTGWIPSGYVMDEFLANVPIHRSLVQRIRTEDSINSSMMAANKGCANTSSRGQTWRHRCATIQRPSLPP